MGELRGEYGDRVDFQIVEPDATKAATDELNAYNLVARGHGLVALTARGEAVFTIAGHDFGREEIELAVKQVASP